MKKLYIGITGGAIIFIVFLTCQNNFASGFDKSKESKQDSIHREAISQQNNETVRRLEQKVEIMEKYIDASNKNLDGWLKVLATFLSVVIAASIFNGLRTHDRAKEELDRIKAIGEDIKTLSKGAKTKLKKIRKVTDQLDELTKKAEEAENYIAGKLDEEKQEPNEPTTKVETKSSVIKEDITKTNEAFNSTLDELIKNIGTLSSNEMETVLMELQKPKYKDRSIEGIVKTTKLPEEKVKIVIEAFVLLEIVRKVVWYRKTFYRLTDKGKGITITE